jgi:hypothetical protein
MFESKAKNQGNCLYAISIELRQKTFKQGNKGTFKSIKRGTPNFT